jgi:serine/threonine-protein kinase
MSEPEQPPPPADGVTTRLDQASGAAPVHDLTGRILGDFKVERRLGQGGMGEVYLAHQMSLDRKVALKVLRPDMLTNPVNLSRFEAEATAVAKLNHPNIVHVYTLDTIDGLR